MKETVPNVRIERLAFDEVILHLKETASDFMPQSAQFMEAYALKLSENACFATMRDGSDKLIGLIAYYANNKEFAFVSRVWVSNLERRNGHCSILMHAVEEECLKLDIKSIRLEVRNDNLAAIKAYTKNGFEIDEVGTTKTSMIKSL